MMKDAFAASFFGGDIRGVATRIYYYDLLVLHILYILLLTTGTIISLIDLDTFAPSVSLSLSLCGSVGRRLEQLSSSDPSTALLLERDSVIYSRYRQ